MSPKPQPCRGRIWWWGIPITVLLVFWFFLPREPETDRSFTSTEVADNLIQGEAAGSPGNPRGLEPPGEVQGPPDLRELAEERWLRQHRLRLADDGFWHRDSLWEIEGSRHRHLLLRERMREGTAAITREVVLADHLILLDLPEPLPPEIEDWFAERGLLLLPGYRFSRVRQVRLPEVTLDGVEIWRDRIGEYLATGGFPVTPEVSFDGVYFPASSVTPNDPQFLDQWSLPVVGLPEAWSITTGEHEVLVGVVDSGIDRNHPDWQHAGGNSNLWTNPGEIANGMDSDGNGLADDLHGWDFHDHNNDPSDQTGHGTRVAGVLGAVGNNGYAIAGVTWKVSLIPLRVGSTIFTESAVVQAIDYLTDLRLSGHPVVISNHSYGRRISGVFPNDLDHSVAQAIARQRDAGILFITAAGGNSTDFRDNDDPSGENHIFPSDFNLPNIVSVLATDSSDGRAYFSNWGAVSVDMGAPGAGIRTLDRGGGVATVQGTSFAAPMVTGTAALCLAVNPHLPWDALKQILVHSGTEIPELAGITTSGRRLDAAAALLEAKQYPRLTWPDSTPHAWQADYQEEVRLQPVPGHAPIASVTLFRDGEPVGIAEDEGTSWVFQWTEPEGTVPTAWHVEVTDEVGRRAVLFPRTYSTLPAYDYWRYRHWGEAFAQNADSLPLADPDGDGRVNLLEFFEQGDPFQANRSFPGSLANPESRIWVQELPDPDLPIPVQEGIPEGVYWVFAHPWNPRAGSAMAQLEALEPEPPSWVSVEPVATHPVDGQSTMEQPAWLWHWIPLPDNPPSPNRKILRLRLTPP